MTCLSRKRALACYILSLAIGVSATATAMAQSPALSQKATGRMAAPQLLSSAQSKGYVRVIVLFDSPVAPSATAPDQAAIATITTQVASARNAILSTHFGGAQPAATSFARGLTSFPITPGFAMNISAQELEALAADPRVVSIQLDALDAPTLNQSLPVIGMPAAYSLGAIGNGQVVAVLDTGVKSNHEFLNGKVVAEACFSNAGGGGNNLTLCPNGQATQTGTGAADANTTNCNNAAASSTDLNLCTHGTHVAGIAAGLNTSVSGSEPLNGVAKFSRIFAVQVFTRFNSANDCGTGNAPCVLAYNSDQLAALNHVYANLNPGGYPVASINMSLGGGQYSGTCDNDARKPIIDNLRAAGVITAIASGNSYYVSAVGAPGCISTAFTVGSTTKADVISSFSNMSNVVDVMAPGSSITSSVVTNGGSTTTYASFNGTSMATPHVAGAIAAYKSRYPGASAAAIESALIGTGVTVADTRSGGTISKPRIQVDRAVERGLWQWNVEATGKFNQDTKSDILWRHANGSLAIWFMNGGSVASISGVASIDNAWSIIGVGDFNGDGTSDILWRHKDGSLAVWLMNGASPGQVLASGSLGSASSEWAVAGIGKFFGASSTADILWRHTNGTTVVWKINGTSVTSNSLVATVPIDWNIAGVGDFNGDGTTDIVWRHVNGDVSLWTMSNGVASSTAGLGQVPQSWSIARTQDLTADGKADLLWRHSNGTTVVWRMNGAVVQTNTLVGAVPTSWNISDVGSFDGTSGNVLWRNADGTAAVWFLDSSGAYVSSTGLGVVP